MGGGEGAGEHTGRGAMARGGGGYDDANVLVLEEGSTECDGVVRACVGAAAEARGDAVDRETSIDLGGDDLA